MIIELLIVVACFLVICNMLLSVIVQFMDLTYIVCMGGGGSFWRS